MFGRVFVCVSMFVGSVGCMPTGGLGQELEAKEDLVGPEVSAGHVLEEKVAVCGSTAEQDEPLIAGIKDGVITVVRGDGSSVSTNTAMPEAVMEESIRLQAKGNFVLVEGTAERLDKVTGELVDGDSDTSFLKYTFLYDSNLNLMWVDKAFGQDHFPVRLDALGGVSMMHAIDGGYSTRYNFSDGYSYELGDVLVIGEAQGRGRGFEERIVPVELYANQNNNKTAAYGWLEIETGKVKLFQSTGWTEWPESKNQNLAFGQRVLSHENKIWALGAGGCGNPAAASVNARSGIHDWVYIEELNNKPWYKMALVDTTANGWSLYNHPDGHWLVRMKVSSKIDPIVELRHVALPQGYQYFESCDGSDLSIDPVGNIYVLGRHPGHVQLFRMSHLQDTWKPVGEKVVGAQDIKVETGYGSAIMEVSMTPQCENNVAAYAPSSTPVLDVSHTQMIGYASWVEKGEMTMITESSWTVSSESGRCVAMQSADGGPLYFMDWDNAARFTALAHQFDQAVFFP